MLFRTHIVFGLFLYLLLVGYVNNWLVVLFGVLLGVVLPDLDSRKSRYGQRWYFRPLQWIVKHRGIMHSVLFGAVLVGIFAMLSLDFGFGFLIGFSSHLFMDLLTRQGVPLLWPLLAKRFGFGIRTGGIFEDIIFVLLLLSDTLLVGYLFFNILL